jgi:acyl-CoA thioesterase FadM
VRDEDYTKVEEVVAPGDRDPHGHLLVYQMYEMLEWLWSDFFGDAHGGKDYTTWQPAPRKITLLVDREAFPGQQLKKGIRVTARTRRTITVEAALWDAAEEYTVLSAEIVTVFADRTTASAIEPPEKMVTGLERLIGGPLPVPA